MHGSVSYTFFVMVKYSKCVHVCEDQDYNSTLLQVFITSLLGTVCEMVGITKLPFGLHPLMVYNGEVSCQSLTGKIAILRLSTHNFHDDQDMAEEEVHIIFSTNCHIFNATYICECIKCGSLGMKKGCYFTATM